MAFLPIYRLATFGTVILFSLIVVGLAAHLTFTTTSTEGVYFVFAAMCLASAGLTLLTVPVMLVIDLVRKGAFTSMVLVEFVWLSILWVLWIAGAALAADADTLNFTSHCSDFSFEPIVQTACREFGAIEAFAFLNWLILLAYSITLLIFALIGASRGHSVWTGSVGTTEFLAPRQGGAEKPYVPDQQYVQQPYVQQPVLQQQQYAYPPQNGLQAGMMQPQHTGSTGMQPQYTGSTPIMQTQYTGTPPPMHPQV